MRRWSIRCFTAALTLGARTLGLGDEETVLDVLLRRLAGSTSAPLNLIAGVTTCALSSLVVAIVFVVCPLGPLFFGALVVVGLLLGSVGIGVSGVGVLFECG